MKVVELRLIDRDSFSKSIFKGTLESARQKNICVAYSNECYELWLLLHFKNLPSFITRENIKKELNIEFQKNFKLKYEKSEKYVYGMLIDRQKSAIERARKLIENIINIDGVLNPYDNNPSTKLHILVECLNSLKDCQNNDYKCN